jgi:hypothetical protein
MRLAKPPRIERGGIANVEAWQGRCRFAPPLPSPSFLLDRAA